MNYVRLQFCTVIIFIFVNKMYKLIKKYLKLFYLLILAFCESIKREMFNQHRYILYKTYCKKNVLCNLLIVTTKNFVGFGLISLLIGLSIVKSKN